MHTKKYLATTLLTGGLVMGLAIGSAQAQEKSLQPQSSWALTKVDRTQQGGNSYCTLSRKYDDDVVLSFARNQTEEYSLAIDFQKPTFTKDKTVKVNLQPGPGQIRAYDLMPTSDKAIVIRLGWDTGFFDTLNTSQNLKAKVGDKDYAFALSEISKGQADLQDCMNAIIASAKGGTPSAPAKDVLSAEATAASNDFAAQKIGDIKASKAVAPAPVEPTIEVKDEDFAAARSNIVAAKDAPVQTNFNKGKSIENAEKSVLEPAAKTASAALEMPPSATLPAPVVTPTPVIVSAPEPVKETSKPAVQKVDAAKIAASEKAAKEAEAQKKAALEKEVAAANAQEKALEEKLATQQKAAEQLAAEKAKSEASAQQAQQNASKLKELETQVATLTAQNTKLQQTGASVVTMKQQNETLQAQVRSLQEEAAGNSKLTPIYETPAEKSEAERLKKEVADLAAQNKSLQSQLAAAQTKAAPATPAVVTEGLAREIETLKAQNKSLQDQLAAAARSIPAPGAAAAATSEVDAKALADAQAKIKELEIKNAQLNDTVRQSQTRIAETAINTEGAALRKIADLEAKLEAAKTDNTTLSQQLDSVRLQQEDKRLNVVAGDWDLEKATKRFNEAEREIRRLGLKLEQERTSCNREKAQIENMLFDPAVTEQKQLEKLASLEAQLQQAEDKLAGRISQTSMSAEPGSNSNADLIASLRQENEALRMQVTDLQSNGTVRADRVASAQIDMQKMKQEMSLKDNQNEALQNQINYLQKENSQIKSRPVAAATASSYVPRPPSRGAPASDKITSSISNQRERLAQSGDPSAASLARMNPAAGTPTDELPARQASSKGGYDSASIQSLLQKSGVNSDGVKKAAVGLPGADNFSWNDSANRNVRGLASVKLMRSNSEFEGLVNEYIANQKAMCPGDFASIPADDFGAASKRMSLYEIACVSGSTNSSASVVFFEDQGRFIAVSNLTNAQDMDVAMDSRDRVANFVRGL